MPESRHPKRQRKKDAAAARREAMRQMMEKQRKQRQYMLIGMSVVLVLAGVGLALFVINRPTKPAASSPKPGTTPAATAAPIACDGKLPEAAGTKKQSFEKPEDQKLKADKTYVWRIETSCGVVDVELATDKSPKITNSIVFLARKGFYDGLTFHRVVPGFVIQGGDPEGTGSGGPGYSVADTPPKSLKYTEGVVAMAKTGTEAPGTAGSQFFIVTGADTQLDAIYGYVGKVSAGIDVAKKIESFQQPGADGPPPQKIYIIKTSIIEK